MAGQQHARYIPPRRERDRSPRLSRMWLALAAVILVAVALAAFMLLRVVCWKENATDLGTVIGTAWNGVTISWDDGYMTSIEHNDMARIERVATKMSTVWNGSELRRCLM